MVFSLFVILISAKYFKNIYNIYLSFFAFFAANNPFASTNPGGNNPFQDGNVGRVPMGQIANPTIGFSQSAQTTLLPAPLVPVSNMAQASQPQAQGYNPFL